MPNGRMLITAGRPVKRLPETRPPDSARSHIGRWRLQADWRQSRAPPAADAHKAGFLATEPSCQPTRSMSAGTGASTGRGSLAPRPSSFGQGRRVPCSIVVVVVVSIGRGVVVVVCSDVVVRVKGSGPHPDNTAVPAISAATAASRKIRGSTWFIVYDSQRFTTRPANETPDGPMRQIA